MTDHSLFANPLLASASDTLDAQVVEVLMTAERCWLDIRFLPSRADIARDSVHIAARILLVLNLGGLGG